jgi:hypothetical protein
MLFISTGIFYDKLPPTNCWFIYISVQEKLKNISRSQLEDKRVHPINVCIEEIYFIEYSLTNFMQYVREYIHILYWYSVCCALHLRGFFFFTFFKRHSDCSFFFTTVTSRRKNQWCIVSVTFGEKYLTDIVTSVPPYETFSLIKTNILRQSKIYKNHFVLVGTSIARKQITLKFTLK